MKIQILAALILGLFSFKAAAQIHNGGDIIRGTGDPNTIATLDVLDEFREGILFRDTVSKTTYEYRGAGNDPEWATLINSENIAGNLPGGDGVLTDVTATKTGNSIETVYEITTDGTTSSISETFDVSDGDASSTNENVIQLQPAAGSLQLVQDNGNTVNAPLAPIIQAGTVELPSYTSFAAANAALNAGEAWKCGSGSTECPFGSIQYATQ